MQHTIHTSTHTHTTSHKKAIELKLPPPNVQNKTVCDVIAFKSLYDSNKLANLSQVC